MKNILLIFITLWSIQSLANNLTIEVNPVQPVVGEQFSLLFNIETTERDEPYISFNPGTARVVGRNSEGQSVMTSIVNGKISIKKTISFRYSLVAEKSGNLRISDIVVDLAGTKLTHKDLRLTVLKEAPETPDIFVLAVPSKTDVFVGEGVDVNYYLYTRLNVIASQIKEYPKLSDFVKRFQNPDERTETVEYGGRVFYRASKYMARVYATAPGIAKIDPLRLEVNYAKGDPNSFFGMSARNMMKRTLISKKVELNVRPLPTENLPTNFTGLVGKHDFKLSVPRTKYLVNEAVEAKLEVTGEGALENFNAPKIYNSEFLEEFDTKSEIVPLNNQVVRKDFEYTLLARDHLQIDTRVETFYYFDPDAERYIGVDVEIPAIEVGGSASASVNKNNPTESKVTQELKKEEKREISLLAPTFIGSEEKGLAVNFYYLNLGFSGAIFLILLSMVRFSVVRIPEEIQEHYHALNKGRYTYTDMFQVLSKLNGDGGVLTKIESSEMNEESKKYFTLLYKGIEQEVFKNQKNTVNNKIKRKHLKELERVLKV